MEKNWLTNEEYDYIYERTPRLCVDLVIKTKEGLLLTFRKIEPAKNTWHLPGGRVRLRETIEHAVKRIAKEETGLKVKIEKFLGYIEFLREKQNGKIRHSVSLPFLVKGIGGKFKGSHQAEEAGFFKKIPKPTYPPHAKFLRDNKILK